ncbi:MAG: tRNA adenosine(34) deaminase TadA [Myxococcota bacterium]
MVTLSDEYWMEVALEEAHIAKSKDEVPVGCVIVKQDKLLARCHNLRETLCDPTAHAEILALREACRKMQSWRLCGCVVYVTLEPCVMCTGALVQARVDTVVFGCTDPKAGCCGSVHQLAFDAGFNHDFTIRQGILAEKSATLLKYFFREKRIAKKAQKKSVF